MKIILNIIIVINFRAMGLHKNKKKLTEYEDKCSFVIL